MALRTEDLILPGDVEGYRAWSRTFDSWAEHDGAGVQAAMAKLPRKPRLSVLMLPDRVSSSLAAQRSLESVIQQWYPHWEMWLPDRSLEGPHDERVLRLPAEPSESAPNWLSRVVEVALGEYLLPVPAYAILARHAFVEVASAITASDVPDLVYSDEDVLDEAGLRMAPRFKPAWDPELMLGRDVVGSLVAYRTERVRQVGGPDTAVPSSEACLYDLSLRIAAMPDSCQTRHIPKVLCSRPLETVAAGTLDGATTRRLVVQHLARRGEVDACVVPSARADWNRVIWPLPDPAPSVTVIVPTRDQPLMLSRCADGVLARTDYPSLELLIVDNGSVDPEALRVMRSLETDDRVRVIRNEAPFNFSTLNNLAASQASGSVLVLLNDDTDVISTGWLRELASQAIRPEVGIVGARLLYPSGQIQHAGIVMSGGGPHHQFRLCEGVDLGPNGELALTRSVTGVTAACIALRKDVYREVRGMDDSYAVAFGDVDLCLRVADLGYRIICTPFAELYHHESVTRGYEDTPAKAARFARELTQLRDRWGGQLATDRFASPQLVFAWDSEGTWGLPRPPGYLGPGGYGEARGARPLVALLRRAYEKGRAIAGPIIANPLFSSEFYLKTYPDVESYRLGPYRHFRRHGVAERRNPNGYFDTAWYLRRNPDVAASKANPLDHYLRHGASEGRNPGPGFSTRFYETAYPEVRSGGHNPLLHFLRRGQREGRRPRR